jgi:hypothetical protein
VFKHASKMLKPLDVLVCTQNCTCIQVGSSPRECEGQRYGASKSKSRRDGREQACLSRKCGIELNLS